MPKKNILAICGSTKQSSRNLHIIRAVAELCSDVADMEIFRDIDLLPHFNPDLDKEPFPARVISFREKIAAADGIFICTPEYVFSLPGSLKNAIEWCVSTTVFSDKPALLITASSHGARAHESLQLVMQTVGVIVDEKTQLLVQGVNSKVSDKGEMNEALRAELKSVSDAFITLLNGHEDKPRMA